MAPILPVKRLNSTQKVGTFLDFAWRRRGCVGVKDDTRS
jgi:hypothetical protein